MNQRTHSWIAIRAIALLDDENKEKNLVKLLKPHARKASTGAWIPDQVDAKRGGAGNITECHVLKMKPYEGGDKQRFISEKNALLKSIGKHRRISEFLESDTSLSGKWWSKPYKGDISKQGRHLPNRAMGLSTMLKDLLLLGDERVDFLVPGKIKFAKYMDPESKTSEQAAAMYFFMLSHFMADISMPCHCDGRKLASYGAGLHKELEGFWSKKIGTAFEKKNLLESDNNAGSIADSNAVLRQAREVDAKFDLHFDDVKIPDLQKGHDIWLEAAYLCRASFALASIIVPCSDYPYDNSRKSVSFKKIFDSNPDLLKDISRVCLYDAVLNTAIAWKHIWNKVSVSN